MTAARVQPRPGMTADFEIRRELDTAADGRRAALERELAERRAYRSSWKPSADGLLPVGLRDAGKTMEEP
jgi:hypothetical protein